MNIFLILIENFLFSISLFLLIPPVPSNELARYHFIPMGFLSVVLFGLSRYLSIKSHKQSIWSLLFQILVFFIYSLITYERFQLTL